MRSALCAFAAAVLLSAPAALADVTQNEHDSTVRQLRDVVQDRDALRARIDALELQRLAAVTQLASGGAARLLLGSAVSANPQLGQVVRRVDWGAAPFITVYPASAARPVLLGGIGEVRLLGAARMLVGGRVHDGRARCEDSVYLIALRDTPGGPVVLLLVAQADDEGRMHYREALQLPAEHAPAEPGAPERPRVAFPDAAAVSDQHPAWQVTVDVPLRGSVVRFRIDMDITMV